MSDVGESHCTLPGAAPGLAYTLTMLAVFAHAIEELIGLPAWAGAHGIALSVTGYGNAALGLALLAVAVLLLGRMFQLAPRMQIVVAVATGALLANVVSHLGASLVSRSLMPGTITAVALVAPGAGWLLARLPLERRIKALAALAGALAMPALAGGALWLSGGIA